MRGGRIRRNGIHTAGRIRGTIVYSSPGLEDWRCLPLSLGIVMRMEWDNAMIWYFDWWFLLMLPL